MRNLSPFTAFTKKEHRKEYFVFVILFHLVFLFDSLLFFNFFCFIYFYVFFIYWVLVLSGFSWSVSFLFMRLIKSGFFVRSILLMKFWQILFKRKKWSVGDLLEVWDFYYWGDLKCVPESTNQYLKNKCSSCQKIHVKY